MHIPFFANMGSEYQANQLVPYELFPSESALWDTEEAASKAFVNNIPVFESIKNGNLKMAEDLVKAISQVCANFNFLIT